MWSPFNYHEMTQDLLIADYQDLGVQVLSNVFSNISKLKQSKKGEALFRKFKKIPAVICGAGPSLEKQIPLLKELKNKALVFGGGSSLNVLSHFSVPFHFAASFDPDPPYRRFFDQTGFEVPFFYQSRVSKRLLSLVHAPLLWVQDNGSYPLEGFLHREVEIEEPSFDTGWTVANFMTALAYHMGCDPIIFIGMDFSESQEKLYAPGVVEEGLKEGRIIAYDQNNHPLYTKKDWLLAAKWTEIFAANHPATFINATEGGLGFEGIPSIPLKDALQRILPSSFDLYGRVHAALSQLQTIFIKEKESVEEFKRSRAQALTLCEKILHIASKYHPAPFQEKGEFILTDFELEEEMITEKFLNPLWDVWKNHFNSEYLSKIVFFIKALKEVDNG